MTVGDDDVAVRRGGARGRLHERVTGGRRHAGLAERQQQLAVLIELEDLIAAHAGDAGDVVERPAIDRPEIAVAVLTQSVRRRERHLEALDDVARGVDVQDAGVGTMLEPESALPVGDDADGGAGLDGAEMRPVLEHPERIGHGVGRRRRHDGGRGRLRADGDGGRSQGDRGEEGRGEADAGGKSHGAPREGWIANVRLKPDATDY